MKVFIVLSVIVAAAFAQVGDLDESNIDPGYLRRPVFDGRIVGGDSADISDYPYQVSLQVNGQHICGASVIGKRWVLTAAHCMEQTRASQVTFRVGSTYHNRGGIVVRAAEIHNHPEYNTRTMDYDVTLIKTQSDLVGPNVQIVPIAGDGDSVPTGKVCTVSGWGHLKSGAYSLPQTLQYVNVPIVDQQTCNSKYARFGGIRGNMFCAGLPGKDSCQGDSGGPLVMNGVQVGVVSWGVDCADARYPGVYARLANANIRAFITNTAHI